MEVELENALKLYLVAKRNNDNKSIHLLKKAMSKLNYIKKNLDQSTEKYINIINQTEAECKKIVNQRINIFKLIDKNDLTGIRELTEINFREINADGNTILHHCILKGDTTILKELLKKGGNINQINGNGNTLLEYACLMKDPNIINFLQNHGCSMKKHLFLRKGKLKLYFNKPDIDMLILLKIVLVKSLQKSSYKSFEFIEKFININHLVGMSNFTVRDLCIGLHEMFLNKPSYHIYKSILVDELSNFTNTNIKQGFDKIDIILLNLVPFINYPFNLDTSTVIKNELKFLVNYNLKKDKHNFKINLLNDIFNIYIKNNLYSEDYIGIIVYQILYKLNL